jgi:hypothetical protein
MGWLDDLRKKQEQEKKGAIEGASGSNAASGTLGPGSDLGDPSVKKHFCWNCAKEIAVNNFHRQDTCEHCGRSTHACKNCEHYDTAYNNLCRESSADRVVEKESSNFCDFFKPSTRGPGAGSKSANDMKTAADALFKKK